MENKEELAKIIGKTIQDFSLEEDCNSGYCDSLVIHFSDHTALYIQSLPEDIDESKLFIEFKT
jgi:hypothetical protein